MGFFHKQLFKEEHRTSSKIKVCRQGTNSSAFLKKLLPENIQPVQMLWLNTRLPINMIIWLSLLPIFCRRNLAPPFGCFETLFFLWDFNYQSPLVQAGFQPSTSYGEANLSGKNCKISSLINTSSFFHVQVWTITWFGWKTSPFFYT